MSATALQRPGPSPRAKLRQAIEAHAEEKHRLDALTEAQSRARSEQHMAQTALTEAEEALHEARQAERANIAFAYANNQSFDDALIAEKSAELDLQRRKRQRAEQVEAAIEAEIQQSQQRLRRREHDRRSALADVVCGSAELAQVMNDTSAAWARLRTLRAVFVAAMNACSGYMPARLMANGQASETLEDRVGYDIDRVLIERWSAALSALASDSDAGLPG
jgi:hypothetical protein